MSEKLHDDLALLRQKLAGMHMNELIAEGHELLTRLGQMRRVDSKRPSPKSPSDD